MACSQELRQGNVRLLHLQKNPLLLKLSLATSGASHWVEPDNAESYGPLTQKHKLRVTDTLLQYSPLHHALQGCVGQVKKATV